MKPFKFLALFLAALFGFWPLLAHAQGQTAGQAYQAALQYYEQGRFQDCIASTQKTVRKDPSRWRAYQLMGNAYAKLGDNASAVKAYDQALRINPDNSALREYTENLRATLLPNPAGNTPQVSAAATAPAPVAPKAGGPKSSLYLYGGGGMPLWPDNFSNSRLYGYSGGFGYGLQLSPYFSIVFEAHESYFTLDSSKFPNLNVTGGEVGNSLLLVNGKIGLAPDGNPLIPYLILGGGLSLFNSNQITAVDPVAQTEAVTPAVSETAFGYRAGLGFEVKAGQGLAFVLDASGMGSTGAYAMIYGQGRLGLKLDL